MGSYLELLDGEGNVVEQLPDDDTDIDELDEALNPAEDSSSEGEEGVEAGEVKEKEEEAPAVEGEPEPEVTEEVEGEKEGEEVEAPAPAFDEENQRLRQLARDQKKELAFMKARLEKLEQAGVDDEAEITPSRVEELQEVINRVATERGPLFETLLESMALSPAYPDINEVCSQDNFNYIISEAAEKIAANDKRDVTEVALELEAGVWQERNPYKTMYELVKTYHPKYVKAEVKEEKVEAVEPKATPPVKKAVAPVVAPTSIADTGPGTKTSMGGWTAKRIDDMEEMELSKVPPEVYEKYLQGQLD